TEENGIAGGVGRKVAPGTLERDGRSCWAGRSGCTCRSGEPLRTRRPGRACLTCESRRARGTGRTSYSGGSSRALLRQERPRRSTGWCVADIAVREADVAGAAEENGVTGSVGSEVAPSPLEGDGGPSWPGWPGGS